MEDTTKRLILHFDILTAVLTFPDESATPEAQINGWLANQRVGVVDKDGNFALDDKDPKLSFVEYLAEHQKSLDDRQRRDLVANFTETKYPGEALKTQFDALVKTLSLPSLVKKSFGIDKTPRAGAPADASQFQSNLNSPRSVVNGNNSSTDFGYLLKSGFMNIFPGFVGLLNSLSREKRRATLVFHGPQLELRLLTDELMTLCEGAHPCFSGSNKTKKVLLDGTKGTLDFRPKEKLTGSQIDHMWTFGDRKYQDVQEWHAGLVYELSAEGNTVAVAENSFVGTYYKDSKVQQIYFGKSPEITDPITLTRIDATGRLGGRAFVSVDPISASLDMEFFTKALAACEADYSVSHRAVSPKLSVSSSSAATEPLSPRSYLHKKLFPALLPVLEMACRDRPQDVNAYIGANLLKFQKNVSFRPPMNGN